MRGGRGCRFAQTKAFSLGRRCHAKSVTDEVEGSNFVPTHGDERSLRPHQSALAGCQLPLQGKPFASPVSAYRTRRIGACPRPYNATPGEVQNPQKHQRSRLDKCRLRFLHIFIGDTPRPRRGGRDCGHWLPGQPCTAGPVLPPVPKPRPYRGPHRSGTSRTAGSAVPGPFPR